MEAELNESSEINSKTDNLAVVDEAILMYIKKEQNKQAYKYTTNIDIDNINIF